MRDELKLFWDAISKMELPVEAADLFGDSWDEEEQHFRMQEAFLIDFKDRAPGKFSDDFGASIVRLSLAFHNSFGGLIVFGVIDGSFTLSGMSVDFDIEAFNRTLSDVTGKAIECLYRRYRLPGANEEVGVLLCPKRGVVKPLRLRNGLGPYQAGMLWVRERHEVLEATPAHLPHLYSARLMPPSQDDGGQPMSIHRSLPPSPATMHRFIGRPDLMRELWEWFVFGDQPRAYLHGPGGSGKSTLAFEFAKTMSDIGFSVQGANGDRVDYVLFLSAKETELNPLTGEQQIFTLRQFEDPITQFKQILFHSGHFDSDRIEAATEEAAEDMLTELFSSYSGLIVLDDIDALSRRKADTGEETLFLKAVNGSKRTRILYTLRYPPSHARRNSFEVPGLSGREFYDFLEACCRQFAVPPPSAEITPKIEEETQSLPLLIETLVGLRRFCGSFQDAVALFRDKGGDEARGYLYQREYDQLDAKGKSREVMATLLLLEEPVHFGTLANLLGFSPQRVSDALIECGSIFLTTVENDAGETLYQLTPPSRPFVRTVSQRLERFNQIERKVELLRKQGGAHTPAEAALIMKMERLLRQEEFDGVVLLGESLPAHDPCLANPHIHARLGQAYANLGANSREKGRECFRHATALGLRDPAMMRSWYYLETRSGYGIEQAKAVCAMMIESDSVGPRIRSEFLSKLAWCIHQEAGHLKSVSREKAIPLFRTSIETYLEAARIARTVSGMDQNETLNWLSHPVRNFIQYLRDDVAPFLSILEELPAKKHDIGLDSAYILVDGLKKVYIPNDVRVRNRLAGLMRRASSKLDRFINGTTSYPGLSHLAERLSTFAGALSPNPQSAASQRISIPSGLERD